MRTNIVKSIHWLISKQSLFAELVKRDLIQMYRSSFLGPFWLVLEPMLFMLLLAFIFGVGLKAGQLLDVPYTAYLLPGLSIFLLFSSVLGSSPNIVRHHSYLLNKVTFDLSVLPFIPLFTQAITHLFTLLPVLGILMYLGIWPNLYWLQVFYYLGALLYLLLGIAFLNASLGVFVPDIDNIVSICGRFLLYLSPIFWDIKVFPEQVQNLLQLNPVYYIVAGYRDTFLFHRGFWEHPWLTAYFWAVASITLLIGFTVFQKTKGFFSDHV